VKTNYKLTNACRVGYIRRLRT